MTKCWVLNKFDLERKVQRNFRDKLHKIYFKNIFQETKVILYSNLQS